MSFAASVLMVGGGIAALPLDWWVRAYFAMGMLMVVQTCFTLAKNVRDVHEAGRMINRIEEARTEKLLSNERA
ncbi:MAG: YiaA/YiaB family inner membrane protein [Tardiphaga sp.]